MKFYHKDITQNKGSALLSSIYSIFFISLMFGIVITRNMIANSKDNSKDVLVRVFMENKLNEIYYINNYKLQSQSYELYNKTFEFQNGKGSFKQIYSYYVDNNGKIVITNLEVYGE